MLARLADERFDVLVIGGGATGLGCAVDAASRGYRTALVEAHDFAAATSSRSTKLVHGGVRYLQEGDVALVREALRERTRLLRNAPAIVHDRAFLTPAYAWWETPYYLTGLKLYDLLAGRSEFAKSRLVSRAETLERLPWLRRSGLRGSVEYHDGQFDDARLAVALARTAANAGAALANYARATSLLFDGARLAGASVRDEESGAAFEVRAAVTVDAGGIFSDRIRRLDDPAAKPLLSFSRGTHVLVSRDAMPGADALLVPKTADGRVIFAIPWHERVLVGTTDVAAPEPVLDPQPTPEEIAYLLATLNGYLERPVDESAITASYAGLRPLVERGAASTAKESREHVVETSASGLVTVTGGKWTTYRKMAEDAIDAAIAAGGLTRAPCATARLRLYDDPSGEVRALIARRPELGAPLHEGFPYTKADAVNGFRNEMARTADDVLARRTRLAFLDARAARAARATVEALQKEIGRPGGRPMDGTAGAG
jgi:glycerol-3-phosphate dehydrogenase